MTGAMLTVEMGALADPLSVQLAALIKDKEMLKRLDLMQNSVTVCLFIVSFQRPLPAKRGTGSWRGSKTQSRWNISRGGAAWQRFVNATSADQKARGA